MTAPRCIACGEHRADRMGHCEACLRDACALPCAETDPHPTGRRTRRRPTSPEREMHHAG